MLQGSYLSRRDENAAARTDLLNDWERDFFVTHKVRKEGGLVTVEAEVQMETFLLFLWKRER